MTILFYAVTGISLITTLVRLLVNITRLHRSNDKSKREDYSSIIKMYSAIVGCTLIIEIICYIAYIKITSMISAIFLVIVSLQLLFALMICLYSEVSVKRAS